MTRKVIHVALNGVTGRMGYRQHLVRSLLSIREQGGVRLADGTVVYPEPVLVGRSEERLRAIAARHGLDRWTTRLDEVLADPEVEVYFDTQVTSAREASLMRAISAGKHVYTEKPVAESLAGRAAAGPGRAGGGHHPRRGARQAVPARGDQAAAAGRGGLLRPGAVGAAGVRLLGVRGRPGRGAAAVVELPRGGRRRDRAGHVPALAVPADRPVRPGHGAVRAERYAHPEAVGRVRAAVRRDRGRRRVRGAGVRQRRGRLGELVLGGPGQPARAARAAGGRDARQRGGGPAALRDPAPGVHADAGVEPGPARPARLPGAMDGRAGQHELRQRVQGRVGAVPEERSLPGQPFAWDLAEGARGVQLAELALQSSAEGRRVDVPPLEV